ncbi:hypothetical protein D3C80_2092260 [compost metagenome]
MSLLLLLSLKDLLLELALFFILLHLPLTVAVLQYLDQRRAALLNHLSSRRTIVTGSGG